jgi:salicylate hydroxylase
VVVGAGPGGLSAALALLDAGFDVHVYEQAPALGEIGAGLQLTPNASRVLHGLGLAEALDRVAVRAEAWQQRRWDDGRIVLRTPLGATVESRFGFPHYQMRRADLITVLSEALPQERLHIGHRCTAVDDRGDRVEVSLDDGTVVRADVVVGADGIHSAVRRKVFDTQAPRFTGCAAFRGLVPTDRVRGFDIEPTAQIWMGPGRHFAHYFVSRHLLNFVAVVDRDAWTRESWSAQADPADALAEFDGWHPQVRAILGAVDNLYVLALFDREPMPHWSAGRVTLLGDACHAMLPFMAQSAAQAIEDAATLAACLRRDGWDLPQALRDYERLRIPRTARLQAMSADNKTRFHLPDGPAQRRRDAQMASGSTDWSYDPIAWVYDHDATIADP